MTRLEERGSGILLLHDVKKVTAGLLPELFKRLKAHGFKLVHMVAKEGALPEIPRLPRRRPRKSRQRKKPKSKRPPKNPPQYAACIASAPLAATASITALRSTGRGGSPGPAPITISSAIDPCAAL